MAQLLDDEELKQQEWLEADGRETEAWVNKLREAWSKRLKKREPREEKKLRANIQRFGNVVAEGKMARFRGRP